MYESRASMGPSGTVLEDYAPRAAAKGRDIHGRRGVWRRQRCNFNISPGEASHAQSSVHTEVVHSRDCQLTSFMVLTLHPVPLSDFFLICPFSWSLTLFSSLTDYAVEEKPSQISVMQQLEDGGPDPLVFVLNANLLAMVKIVNCKLEICSLK